MANWSAMFEWYEPTLRQFLHPEFALHLACSSAEGIDFLESLQDDGLVAGFITAPDLIENGSILRQFLKLQDKWFPFAHKLLMHPGYLPESVLQWVYYKYRFSVVSQALEMRVLHDYIFDVVFRI